MGPAGLEEFRNAMLQKSTDQSAIPSTNAKGIGDVNPLRRAEIQWEDRIDNQKKVAVGADDHTLGAWIKLGLTKQQRRVAASDLSVGRFMSEKTALTHFRDWAGSQVDVATISGKTLSRYHAYLLELIASKDCAPSYARDRMMSVRTFVRWLWGQDAVEKLPKNIDSNELKITIRPKTPETLDLLEVSELLRKSSGRTRLYILLGLNCGITQKDISDLLDVDVSWRDGTITRKRSKTHKHAGVPTVTYKLWPETLELLRDFRSGSDVVLLNRNGNRLVEEHLTEDGEFRKTDNIKNAYERVLRKVSFSKPFTLTRKTSATLINADNRFRGLDQLFLGHAPATIAEKHYTATSKSALDEALAFLRKTYTVDKMDDADGKAL
jgi:integrase